jgi:hypothetical protein
MSGMENVRFVLQGGFEDGPGALGDLGLPERFEG